jgi:two-component system, NarL family, sensor kinase
MGSDINTLVLSFVFIFVLMIVLMFLFVTFFNKKRMQYILEKQEAARAAEREIEQARIEVQEHSLKNISWELHDNIGQLLSVSKLNLSMISQDIPEKDKSIVNDTTNILGNVLADVRMLSKSLNQDAIRFNGILKATSIEIDRFNKMNYLNAIMHTEGEEFIINETDEILIFRIIQEILSNVIKHAKAQNLNVKFEFAELELNIEIEDDGQGVGDDYLQKGLGFTTMTSRAKLLGATIEFKPVLPHGLKTMIKYKKRKL